MTDEYLPLFFLLFCRFVCVMLDTLIMMSFFVLSHLFLLVSFFYRANIYLLTNCTHKTALIRAILFDRLEILFSSLIYTFFFPFPPSQMKHIIWHDLCNRILIFPVHFTWHWPRSNDHPSPLLPFIHFLCSNLQFMDGFFHSYFWWCHCRRHRRRFHYR